MSTWVPAICVGLFCIENFLIGRYFGSRRGMQSTTVVGIAVLGVVAAGALVYSQQRYEFVAERRHILLTLAFGVVGFISARRTNRAEAGSSVQVIPWAQLQPGLTRFAGTKVHIVHQSGIDGPNTASRLVAETLSKVGMTVSTSALNRVPLHTPVNEAVLVVRIWSEQVDVAGNAGVIRFAVRQGHGPERGESVTNLRMTTMSILSSVYRCLASTQQGA